MARRMLCAATPKRPMTNSENPIAITASMVSSGVRRKAVSASRRAYGIAQLSCGSSAAAES
jgi:hypothetical protein